MWRPFFVEAPGQLPSLPSPKSGAAAGWALCKLRMAFKQILADLTQETANYGSFFGYSLEMKIQVAKSFGFYQLAHTVEPHLTVTSLVRKPPNYSHPGSVPNCIPQLK